MSAYQRPEPLSGDHLLDDFDCGSDTQTRWLQRHARQAHAAGASRVYVATRASTNVVVGYFALAAGSVTGADVSTRVTKGTGRYPIPVVVLTRLGVDVAEQRKGLGRGLVQDALIRVAGAADAIGVRALLIHAESESAVRFYRALAEFETSPTDPMHLMLLMKDLKRAIR